MENEIQEIKPQANIIQTQQQNQEQSQEQEKLNKTIIIDVMSYESVFFPKDFEQNWNFNLVREKVQSLMDGLKFQNYKVIAMIPGELRTKYNPQYIYSEQYKQSIERQMENKNKPTLYNSQKIIADLFKEYGAQIIQTIEALDLTITNHAVYLGAHILSSDITLIRLRTKQKDFSLNYQKKGDFPFKLFSTFNIQQNRDQQTIVQLQDRTSEGEKNLNALIQLQLDKKQNNRGYIKIGINSRGKKLNVKIDTIVEDRLLDTVQNNGYDSLMEYNMMNEKKNIHGLLSEFDRQFKKETPIIRFQKARQNIFNHFLGKKIKNDKATNMDNLPKFFYEDAPYFNQETNKTEWVESQLEKIVGTEFLQKKYLQTILDQLFIKPNLKSDENSNQDYDNNSGKMHQIRKHNVNLQILVLSLYSLYTNEPITRFKFFQNLDLSQVLGIDIQDAYSGEHQQNIDGINLKKARLNEDGDILENDISQKMIDPAYDGSDQEYEDFKKAVQNREMCQITGAFIMQKNPGNFHFSFHSKEDLLEQLKQNRKDLFPQINLDYQINQLFFGNYEQNEIDFEEKSNQMQQSFNSQSLQEKILKQFFNFDKTLYAPYNKLVFLGDQKNEYENYIKILPLNFDYKNVKITKMQKKQMQSYLTDLYQYSMTSTAIPKRSDERTNLYFRYEVSPVNLNYSLKYNTFYHFIVQILAIIGGVFAVLGIVSSNFEDLVQKLKYKIQQPIQLINEQMQK
ncbi:hypothetical protein PPERSA_01578 [Pseudocohnilembus persalinus]|uniref:Endoplasmic reticulum vesicle transporter C-terminal domain-containing protein n=1 Tax=Pseudocohnilembus persalinus TaxID=266149 RepID=A0A0V0QHP8_PSEPJ|nr:hypothetical protein PPERSA_01578 [Pseudocohnilembus persalinus]|eukprot:KRX01708.1 hypothetical protein PPERSA_01578 [Pseudocohnilembus persalinus]